MAIAKNATSTLRKVLSQDCYKGYQTNYAAIEPSFINNYFLFTFLRDPVDRTLSGYQEISMRHEASKLSRSQNFFSMTEGKERFVEFLDELERHKWDSHIVDQVSYLPKSGIDFLGTVEFLERDFSYICQHLGMGTLRALPRLRSRQERKNRFAYKKHLLYKEDLDVGLVKRIEHIYEEDMQLYHQVLKDNEDQLLALY